MNDRISGVFQSIGFISLNSKQIAFFSQKLANKRVRNSSCGFAADFRNSPVLLKETFPEELVFFNSSRTLQNLTSTLADKTLTQYDNAIAECREIFLRKTHDYGTAWRVLRPKSLTDQIFIKAKRIKTIEEKGVQQVSDGIAEEFMGIINYGIIALIQLELGEGNENLSADEALQHFDSKVNETRDLMLAKNHDYGEAWREMRASSFTDLVLMKLMRLKQIEDHDGKTLISEGPESNYKDIINYSVFALIQLSDI